MNKTVCIYHSIDLDGWMSAAEVIHHFEKHYDKVRVYDVSDETTPVYYFTKPEPKDDETLVMIGYNYGDPIPDLSEYDKVIMCDISFPAEIIGQMAFEKGSNFIWIDHHISAINDYEKLHKEFNEKHNRHQKYPAGLRDTNFAACELTWHFFFPDEPMPEIVRLLGRYDCFGHKFTETDRDRLIRLRNKYRTDEPMIKEEQDEILNLNAKLFEEQKVLEFQYGARQCISNYKEAYDYLKMELNSYLPNPNNYDKEENPIYKIWNNGKAIYQYLCIDAKQSYKNGFEIKLVEEITDSFGKNIVNRNFICINKERFNPINFGINYHEDGYDGCACFYRRSDGKWSFSLYNDNGKVDCSVIAKQYGGGGHSGASGFICDDNVFFNLINN